MGNYFNFCQNPVVNTEIFLDYFSKRLVDVVLVLGVNNSTVRTNSNWEQVFELMCPLNLSNGRFSCFLKYNINCLQTLLVSVRIDGTLSGLIL